MRVLLDTNIIIHREASKGINRDIGVLFHWLDKLKLSKHIHPLTVEEIQRNISPETVNTMQIKLDNYQVLKTEAPLSATIKRISEKVDINGNDINDTRLLNEVYSDRVDILISEDKKIHAKAKALDISNRVFRIETFLEKVIAENPKLVDYSVLAVKKDHFGNINLQDSFFDSFRKDYPGFDKWFNRKADEIAYVCYESEVLSAFLFIKIEDETENYSDISPIFSKKKRLKIGTFKVISNGFKIGERFLKIIFDNARKNQVDEIYVTIFDNSPEQSRLILLLEEYGFKHHGVKNSSSGLEQVYVREFSKIGIQETPKLTFPWLSKEADVYIIPIRPEYHTELFPDSILRTESPLNFVENQPHRNAISKVYVSHSFVRDLQTGDIIIFYRTSGGQGNAYYKSVMTTIGIVDNVITNIKTLEELKDICRKRTVLSNEELGRYWDRNPKNRPFVINFLYAFSFRKRMNLKAMLDNNIITNFADLRTIKKIDIERLRTIITLSGI